MFSISIIINKYKRILTHIFFWIAYLVFFGFIYGKYGHDYSWYFMESLVMLPFVITATYFTIYVILPFYLKKRKLLQAVFFEIALLFFVTLGERVALRLVNSLQVNVDTLFGITFLYLFLETNFMVGIAFAVKFVKKWFEQQQEKHEIEKRNLRTELKLLKAQLHPHFLFNTMNNLYSLSLEQSSRTSEGIAKISELLRSVLYDCNEAEITLNNEINLIENYIDLEKMRYGERLKLSFIVEGPVHQIKIAPMILFTFVENCFKHGSSKNPGTPYISIQIKADNNHLLFYAENDKCKLPEKTKKKQEGIGLINVKKRLEIIYHENYRLDIEDGEQTFKIALKIFYPETEAKKFTFG